jgi:lysophospholipase L1-like esterase
MLIEPNSRLVMIGDSITDCGRGLPVGESVKDNLGNGYVSLINALLTAKYPAHRIRVLNTGISGNTVLDLQARWKKDVLALKPDWLSVMIGINDVWRQFDSPMQPEWHVSLDMYNATLEKLVAQTRPLVKGLVLMSPYFLEPNRSEPMRAMMDDYGTAMRKISKQHQAIFVDIQAEFDVLMRDIHPMTLAWDRVHPSQTGHMLLARSFLHAVGFDE